MTRSFARISLLLHRPQDHRLLVVLRFPPGEPRPAIHIPILVGVVGIRPLFQNGAQFLVLPARCQHLGHDIRRHLVVQVLVFQLRTVFVEPVTLANQLVGLAVSQPAPGSRSGHVSSIFSSLVRRSGLPQLHFAAFRAGVLDAVFPAAAGAGTGAPPAFFFSLRFFLCSFGLVTCCC